MSIGARFELPQESREALIKEFGDGSVPDENGFYNGVVFEDNDDGTTKIIWKGDAAIIGNENDGQAWGAKFSIQAKDDFIGGNMVPTNGSTSGIYLKNGDTKLFPQPSVNVRPLSLSVKNVEKWAYNGDDIESIPFADRLYETFEIVQLDGKTTKTGKLEWSKLTDVQKDKFQKEKLIEDEQLIIGEDKTFEYCYPDTKDPVGYFVYKYEIVDNEGKELGNMGGHDADKAVNEVEKYKLTVEFVPYTVDERDEDNRLSAAVQRQVKRQQRQGNHQKAEQNLTQWRIS